MSDHLPEKKTTGAESPTTAREPDFDDDYLHETSSTAAPTSAPERIASPAKEPKRVSFQEEEAPPAKPPRPTSPPAETEATLIDAFPSIDSKVVKAVLVASGGKAEPAFNALLSMSDPNFAAEHPIEQSERTQGRQEMSQMEADELYARQLAEHYGNATPRHAPRSREDPRRRDAYGEEREHSFFDDDLPEIRKNIQKGFQETQKTVNKWLTDFKKRLDGDEDDEPIRPSQSSNQPQRQNFGPSQSEQLYGIRRSAEQSRRSGDRERYDADPRVLSDDFRELHMEDNETPPRRPPRPQANPDLFKSTPAVPQGPIDEVDALYRDPTPPQNRGSSPSAGKSGKKWQPLTSVAPAPVHDDNDPFSLGDSDEEETKKIDLKPSDTERLKKRASVSESGKGGTLEEADRSGTKNKEAEELLKGSGGN